MALERIRFGRCTLLFPTTSVGTAAGEEQRRRPPREVTCARAQPPAETTGRDVAGMLKPAAGVVTSDGAERIADRLVHGLDGTRFGGPHCRLDLGSSLFDGGQVRRVGRQEHHVAGRSHGQSSRWTYVRNVGPARTRTRAHRWEPNRTTSPCLDSPRAHRGRSGSGGITFMIAPPESTWSRAIFSRSMERGRGEQVRRRRQRSRRNTR
jgi:hypothetical protein